MIALTLLTCLFIALAYVPLVLWLTRAPSPEESHLAILTARRRTIVSLRERARARTLVTMLKRIVLSALALALVSCAPDPAYDDAEADGIGTSPSVDVSARIGRCAEVAEWHCRCDITGYDAQATEMCLAHTADLCERYPDLPEWSDTCRAWMDSLECPLRGPIDGAACAESPAR